MSPFSTFEFSVDHPRKRSTLTSVMPTNPTFSYAALLVDAYLCRASSDVHLRGFHDLCVAVDESGPMIALKKARASGVLSEGVKKMAPPLAAFLASTCGQTVYLRSDDSNEVREVASKRLDEDLRAFLPAKGGELELCSGNGLWYVGFRDDDPLMFLAASRTWINELVCRFPDTCLVVPRDCIYSP